VLVFLIPSSYAKYSGGDGSASDPFQIATPNDLNEIGDNFGDWNKHFLMTSDIDMNSLESEELIIGSQIINSPYSIDFDSKNQILYWGDGSFWRKNMNTGDMNKNDIPGVYIWSIALDVNDGKIYCTTEGTASTYYIYRCDTNGLNTEEVLNLGSIQARDIEVDPNQQKMYWSTYSAESKIYRANLDGSGVEEIVNPGTGRNLIHLALDTVDGKIYFFETDGPTLQRCNLDGTSKEILISSGLSSPKDLVVDNSNSRLYWIESSLPQLYSANLDGTDQTSIYSHLGPNPYGIVLDTEQVKIYFSELYYDRIWRITPNGTNREIVCENYFMGVFEGNDFTIRNFSNTYESPTEMVGLFGVIGRSAEIRNLNLECDLTFSNCDYAGGLVGASMDGNINNCHIDGSIESLSNTYVGGLVGSNEGTILNCSANISIQNDGCTGGLVGYNKNSGGDGTIWNSWSTGSVSGADRVGGLVGFNGYRIYNSYSNALVVGNQYVGGFAGMSGQNTQIINCYSSGHVSGTLDTGGFVGYISQQNDRVEYCFWDITTSEQTESAAGAGFETEFMFQKDTYFDWTCDQVWTIDDGNDYPRLYWQDVPGVLLPFPAYSGGKGTESQPYLINTAEQLALIGRMPCQLDCHYTLISDVDLSSYSPDAFPIIGGGQGSQNRFSGVFDGMGHSIHHFIYQPEIQGRCGLFGWISLEGQIKNLTLIDPNVIAPEGFATGSVVGYLQGNLSNCFVTGGFVKGKSMVGGLAGQSYGTITQCSADGIVIGIDYVGGLVGSNSGKIAASYSDSSVSGSQYVGGLVGNNNQSYGHYSGSSVISDSYASGFIEADSTVGGFVGKNNASIQNCWTSEKVQGVTNVGAFAGEIEDDWDLEANYSFCFWDVNVNPGLDGIGTGIEPNIVGLPTTEMQMESTFTEAGWDFVGETINGPNNIWSIHEGHDYPKLVWSMVQFINWIGVDFQDYSFFANCWMQDINDYNDTDFINNGFIDFEDFAYFADYWGLSEPNFLHGVDLTKDGIVDYNDLHLFNQTWLAVPCYEADLDFSGAVDTNDVNIFTSYWLFGK
jgi:hypothetical protein